MKYRTVRVDCRCGERIGRVRPVPPDLLAPDGSDPGWPVDGQGWRKWWGEPEPWIRFEQWGVDPRRSGYWRFRAECRWCRAVHALRLDTFAALYGDAEKSPTRILQLP